MTKEEIAYKETSFIFDEHELAITGLANAMEIYAKQEAIGFAFWVNDKGFECISSYDKNEKIWECMKTESRQTYTTEQLFELYIQSKK